jgi:nicotinate phosphoribosyltransferase
VNEPAVPFAAASGVQLDRRFAGLYGQSLALLTDLYELTMAYGYWKLGTADRNAVFHLAFREHPFNGGFTIACGLHSAIEYLQSLRFEGSDLEYLATLTGNDGAPLFEPAFLEFLAELRFTCDVDAIPEGTVVFPNEPLVRVRGPILQAQILETPLLNLLNYQTLVATKSARICLATKGEPVLEFGLRRAQGIDGGVSASRAAYVGGAAATSNLLAGKLFGIPVRGTHAHSWVMSFESEQAAFEGYAAALPNNCVFLVDTYDTLEGVRRAIEVGHTLRARGHEMVGIRLDSGDLAWLSVQARALLDDAGFPDAHIVATNDLDEHIIHSLKEQGARVAVWGVGTRLVTAYDQPALGGVYKLAAIADAAGEWQYRIKVSEQTAKVSIPGVQQVRRWRRDGEFVADAIYDEALGMGDAPTIVDPLDATRRRTIEPGIEWEELLVPIYRGGALVYDAPSLESVRDRAQTQLAGFHAGVKRFVHPHQYPVGLERRLHDLRTRLILEARGFPDA